MVKHFLAMGGYGYYIWLAYATACGVLLGNIAFCCWRHRQVLKDIRRSKQK